MKTAGRTRAIEVNANRDVRHESPAAVKGSPYFEDGTHQSASQHISSRPSKTFDTSRCGSHKTNPRPIMSIAALLKALLAVGVDCLFIMFEDEPPDAEVGVATALESVLLPLRCELASGPAVD